MKILQTQSDFEYLKAVNASPIDLIKAIEQDFLDVLEAEGVEEDQLLSYRLPFQQAFILLEAGDDVRNVIGESLHIEYIEKVIESNVEYYRIAKRFDHEFQMIYSLVGVHDENTKHWLEEHAE
jgi:DNA-dependent RNA polymerase auxiliary subunit epsilon